MAIDVTKDGSHYHLEYTLYGSDWWWGWYTETMCYMWYSKREAIQRFKQHLREKYPSYNFDFDRRTHKKIEE